MRDVGVSFLNILVMYPLFSECILPQPKYYSNSELETVLRDFSKSTKGNLRSELYSIGQTLGNNQLWVVNITASPQGKLGIPNVKLIGNIHGNEAVGRAILIQFLYYLREEYNKSETISWLLNNTIIHVLPNLNPDGFDEAAEKICKGTSGKRNGEDMTDLDDDFPNPFVPDRPNRLPRAHETLDMMKWMTETPFVLSASMHGGALIAKYPFDANNETITEKKLPSITPDDDVFRHLASTYAKNHKMSNDTCPDQQQYENGIANGALWEDFQGGKMQDYNYVIQGCMEITLYISCCKYPPAKDLPRYWEENKNALIGFVSEGNQGITGQIVDAITKQPIGGARVKICGREIFFYSRNFTGEFWRILLPGSYTLEVQADGYYNTTFEFVVPPQREKLPKLQFLKIEMLNSSYPTTTISITSTSTITLPTTKKLSFNRTSKSIGEKLEQKNLSKKFGQKNNFGTGNKIATESVIFIILFLLFTVQNY